MTAGPARQVPLESAAFAIGRSVPTSVVAPRTAADVAAALRNCDRAREAAVLFGGGTLQGMGRVPARYDVAIALGALDRVLAHEVEDFTIAIEAGASVEAFSRALAERGQFVPLDVPRARDGTIGGALAAGWLGPRRATYGRPRDFVIGTTVALADGTLASAGGMVVKNVTGYDTSRLYVGSLGTLAAIVRANFKTLPLPQSRRLALAPLPEGTRDRAIEHVAALRPEPALVLAVRGFAEEIAGPSGLDGRILVLYEGSRATVDGATRALRSALGAAGVAETTLHDDVDARVASAIDAYVARLGERSTTYRSFGDPFDVGARADRARKLAERYDLVCETICDGRTGDAIVRVSRALTAEFADAALAFDRAFRGALHPARLQSAPAALRAEVSAFSASLAAPATMAKLKARFDPNGTLAPGRWSPDV